MIFVIIWIVSSLVIGVIASDRTIGFWGALLISLCFSPLIGLIFTLLSKTNKEVNYRNSILRTQKSQQESLQKIAELETIQRVSIADEIEKLEKLKINNSITEDEFLKLKNKIIGSTENNHKTEVLEKSYPHSVNQNVGIKNPSFSSQKKYILNTIAVIIVVGIVLYIINRNSDSLQSDSLQSDSEITEQTPSSISNASHEIFLKNFTFEDIARFAISTSMQEPIKIFKSSKQEKYYCVSYVRPSDSQKFEFKVKFEGNKIIYGDLYGRWQDTEYDEKLSFEESDDGLNIITTYSDGSQGVEKYKKGD
jgi:hypothetical protein